MTYPEAVILGAFQGVTELFPVSSLGHAVLIPAIVGGSWKANLNATARQSPYLAFIVGMHVATAIAMIVYFWRDWLRIIRGLAGSLRQVSSPAPGTGRFEFGDTDQKLAWMIIAGTIPVGIAGLLLDHAVTHVLAKPAPTAVFLALNGVLLFGGERLRRRRAGAGDLAADVRLAGGPAISGHAPDGWDQGGQGQWAASQDGYRDGSGYGSQDGYRGQRQHAPDGYGQGQHAQGQGRQDGYGQGQHGQGQHRQGSPQQGRYDDHARHGGQDGYQQPRRDDQGWAGRGGYAGQAGDDQGHAGPGHGGQGAQDGYGGQGYGGERGYRDDRPGYGGTGGQGSQRGDGWGPGGQAGHGQRGGQWAQDAWRHGGDPRGPRHGGGQWDDDQRGDDWRGYDGRGDHGGLGPGGLGDHSGFGDGPAGDDPWRRDPRGGGYPGGDPRGGEPRGNGAWGGDPQGDGQRGGDPRGGDGWGSDPRGGSQRGNWGGEAQRGSHRRGGDRMGNDGWEASGPGGYDQRAARQPEWQAPARGAAAASGGQLPARQVEANEAIEADRRLTKMSWRSAIILGAAQILALFPGFSRDGSVMVFGMARGLTRQDAVRFSFLLSTPVILAAGLFKAPELLGPETKGIHGPIIAGMIVAGISAYLALWFLDRMLSNPKRTLTPFAIYCLIAGIASLFLI
jgi:undecaprenyl pyrophosphate phosphatase UppP